MACGKLERSVAQVLTLILNMSSKSYFFWQNLSLILSLSLALLRCLSSGKQGFSEVLRNSDSAWTLMVSLRSLLSGLVCKQEMSLRNLLFRNIWVKKKSVLNECLFVKMRKNDSLHLSFSWSPRVLAWWLYFNFGIYCQQRKDIDEKLHWAN